MIYQLFQYLDELYDFPGSGLFQFLSFRAIIALITSMMVATLIGKKIIQFLQKKQMGEIVRNLGLQGENLKAGTPTMGGIIIILATLIPTILFTDLSNIYIILLIITTLWMGVIGFLDDYLKAYRKNKEGLRGKFKVIGQVGLGLIVGSILYFNDNVVIKEELITPSYEVVSPDCPDCRTLPEFSESKKSLKTNVPFMKNNEINYQLVADWLGLGKYSYIVFIFVVIFIITAVSNGANLTDGIDGLAAGTSAIIVSTLGLFAWLSGNIIAASYLNIFYIPASGEIVVFCCAFAGALIGFIWYNTFPAQVFMGDTGSLTIGGVIAVIAISIRKELILPVLCGIFLAESLSVMIQVAYFKYTKRKTGEGKRIFLMSPLHHHYQKLGYHESKIVNRMLIIGIFLAAISVITLKIR